MGATTKYEVVHNGCTTMYWDGTAHAVVYHEVFYLQQHTKITEKTENICTPENNGG